MSSMPRGPTCETSRAWEAWPCQVKREGCRGKCADNHREHDMVKVANSTDELRHKLTTRSS
jgi:hypothetical protein